MTPRRVLYIDPWMGLAGDMLLAALLDIDREGARLEEALCEAMRAIGIDPGIVSVAGISDHGLCCTSVRVADDGGAPLRHLADITRILDESTLPERVRVRSRAAFERLAQVEAEVHGCSMDEIHFHEVGAVDTLVDVVGVLSLVEALEVDEVVVGEIPLGGGTVTVAHGTMRVPAPATAALLQGYPCVGGPEMRELTTPTGALLVGELGAVPGPMPRMIVESIGYGSGTLRFDSGANVVRVVVGTMVEVGSGATGPEDDVVVELETNLDDVTPEVIGHAVRALREAGALEVWTTPAFMKKDRPGVVLHALVEAGDEHPLSDVVMRETGSLGVRRTVKSRTIAERGAIPIDIDGVAVRVKWGRHKGELTSVAAEYDDAARAAGELGVPVGEVMLRAAHTARAILAGERRSGRRERA